MGDQPIFKPSCPNDVQFLACDYGTRFLGCCAGRTEEEVCANGCMPEDLESANFDQQYYSYMTPNECNSTLRAGEWYTCEQTSPPFLGCCATNACSNANGCPLTQLVPAQLSSNDTRAAPFSSIFSQQMVITNQTTSTKTRTSAIVGGAVGSAMFIAILVGSSLWYRIRNHRKSNIQEFRLENVTKGI